MCGPTAIHRECRTYDRRRGRARKEHYERAEFVDRGETLVRLLREQDVADDLFAWNAVCLGLAVDLRLDQRGIHIARADGVAGDVVFGGLERRNFRQAEYAVLGGDVGRLER